MIAAGFRHRARTRGKPGCVAGADVRGPRCPDGLASTQLECELRSRETERALDEAGTTLATLSTEKDELAESLARKEERIAHLEQSVCWLNGELREVHQLHRALDRWFQPQLRLLEETIAHKLDSLEHRQATVNQALQQVDGRLQAMQSGGQGVGLSHLMRRTLRKLAESIRRAR